MKKSPWKIIIVVIAVVIAGWFIYTGTSAAKIESPSGFGYWGQTIYVEYIDGTFEPLNTVLEDLSVYHNEKEVESLRYELSVKADGSGDIVRINMESYSVKFTIGSELYLLEFPETILTIPSGSWNDLVNKEISIEDIVGDLSTDIYQMDIIPQGTITYSYNNGIMQSALLPISVRDSFEVIEPNTARLTISSGSYGTTDPLPGTYYYDIGLDVTLTAIANSGYHFSGWSGDISGTTNPYVLAMNSDKTVTANFEQNTQNYYTLAISVIPSGSPCTVTKSPDETQYVSGTVVTLTAIPASGYTFSSWSGSLSGNQNPTTITMTSNKDVTANFVQNLYTLSTSVVGSGSITKVPDQASYAYGVSIQVTAVPATNWLFDYWGGDLSGSVNPETVIMNTNKVIVAHFMDNTPFILVNTPNGGEVWTNGFSHAIIWSSNFADNVMIDLYKGGAFYSTIIASAPNDGSYSWIIPSSIIPGTDYKIRVSRVSNPSIFDESNSNFEIETGLPTYEDLTTFTLVNTNPDSVYTVTPSTVTAIDICIGEQYDSYLQKNYGTNYFSGDFEVQWESTLLAPYYTANSFAGMVGFAVSDLTTNLYEMLGIYLGVSQNTGSLDGNSIHYWQHLLGTDTVKPGMFTSSVGSESYITGLTGYTYYYTYERSGTTVTLSAYSDEARTNLVGYRTHGGVTVEPYSCILVAYGRGNGPFYSGTDDVPCSLSVSNLEIISH